MNIATHNVRHLIGAYLSNGQDALQVCDVFIAAWRWRQRVPDGEALSEDTVASIKMDADRFERGSMAPLYAQQYVRAQFGAVAPPEKPLPKPADE